MLYFFDPSKLYVPIFGYLWLFSLCFSAHAIADTIFSLSQVLLWVDEEAILFTNSVMVNKQQHLGNCNCASHVRLFVYSAINQKHSHLGIKQKYLPNFFLTCLSPMFLRDITGTLSPIWPLPEHQDYLPIPNIYFLPGRGPQTNSQTTYVIEWDCTSSDRSAALHRVREVSIMKLSAADKLSIG